MADSILSSFSWNDRISAQEDEIQKVHFLKRGLAHDLLTGRVRVRLPSSLRTTKGLARSQGV